MRYTLIIKPKAEKHFEKIPKEFQQKIKIAFLALAEDPFLGKKLSGKYSGQYSLRVWPYRIIYEIYKNQLMIVVVDVDHRQGVYK